MVWKLLLYPVAYAIDYISNHVVTLLWGWIGMSLQARICMLLPERCNPSNPMVLFLLQVLQMLSIRFCSSIGAVMLLGLWGHKFSWAIFLFVLIVREFHLYTMYSISSHTGYIIKRGNLTGSLIGLALVAVLTAIVTG